MTFEAGSSTGSQYACRPEHLERWLRVFRPRHYDSYMSRNERGCYSEWLRYMFEDGDSYVGERFYFKVPVGDRRVYFRAALTAIIQNIPFEEIDDFGDDTSTPYRPVQHDGRAKLNALVALMTPHKEIVYVGSGEVTEWTRYIETLGVKIAYIDPFLGEPGLLETYDFSGKIVLADAYYEGFSYDQHRLKEAQIYYAKGAPVREDDYVFFLPGSSEARYTNDKRFQGFMVEYMARLMRAGTRDEAVKAAFEQIEKSATLKISEPDTMGYRLAVADLTPLKGSDVAYEEMALFMSTDIVVNGVAYTKRSIEDKYRTRLLRPEVRDYLKKLADSYAGKGTQRKFWLEQLKLYPDYKELNFAMIRGLNMPVIDVVANDMHDQITRELYGVPSANVYLAGIRSEIRRILHFIDTRYVRIVASSPEFYNAGVEIIKQYSKLSIEHTAKNHTLLALCVEPIDLDFSCSRVIFVGIDARISNRDVAAVHELGLCSCRDRHLARPQGYSVIHDRGAYGFYSCMREHWDRGGCG